MVERTPGVSVRVKLALSYAGFLVLAGALLLAVVYLFLLRYVPADAVAGPGPFFPGRYDLIRAFVPAAAWAMLVLLLFGLLGGWILAGRMLAPLRRITAATRKAAAGSLSHRIELEGPGDEFRELADAFDAMLARLEAQVAEQQRFAANASHELRTPLAITQALLDVAQSDPEHDDAQVLERLRIVNARAIELIEALLLLSRSDRRAFTSAPVDLSLIAEEAAETLLPLAERQGVVVETAGDAAAASGSYALLLQLTTNLVHNAIVHNLPEGGEVRIRTAVEDGQALLVVENTGPRLSPELIPTLTEPFQRGSARSRRDHGGVGLGLAIVQSIVRAHGGTLVLEALPGGGLRASARLPAV